MQIATILQVCIMPILFDTINEYIDEIKNGGENFAIGMIDIDHFKR